MKEGQHQLTVRRIYVLCILIELGVYSKEDIERSCTPDFFLKKVQLNEYETKLS